MIGLISVILDTPAKMLNSLLWKKSDTINKEKINIDTDNASNHPRISQTRFLQS